MNVYGFTTGKYVTAYVTGFAKIGRDDWIRTSDPLTPSQVRYQAAPHPEIFHGGHTQTDRSENFGLAEAQRAEADLTSQVLLSVSPKPEDPCPSA